MSTNIRTPGDEQLPTNEKALQEVFGDSTELVVMDLLMKYEDGLAGRDIVEATGTEADRLQMALPQLAERGILEIKQSGGTTLWSINQNNRIANRMIRVWSACRHEVVK